jgi:hypothetical protein
MDQEEFHPFDRQVLTSLLQDIERSFEQDDFGITQRLLDRWNHFQRTKTPADQLSSVADSFGLETIAQVVRDRGLRLRSLEEAVKAGRVTLKGNVRLNKDFIKALRGEESLRLERWSLKLEFRF